MYGGTTYGQEAYGSDEQREAQTIAPPLVSASFTVYAPTIYADLGIMVPLISNAFQVFPPASIEAHGRPLAEDIRIMRVRRAE